MKQTRILMGMPITVEIIDQIVRKKDLDQVYDYFQYVDEKFSVYKKKSEISLINLGQLKINQASPDMKTIFKLAEKTKQETDGYFDIYHNGKFDSSGIVKGWAIFNAAKLLKKLGFKNFYVEAGGDIQVSGKNTQGKNWVVGLRNPFCDQEIIKILGIFDKGVATSGTYVRGQHIYNPKKKNSKIKDVMALTVIGPNIYEADRFATAAFAIGKKGIKFIENLSGFEGYLVDKKGIATFTRGFEKYVLNHD